MESRMVGVRRGVAPLSSSRRHRCGPERPTGGVRRHAAREPRTAHAQARRGSSAARLIGVRQGMPFQDLPASVRSPRVRIGAAVPLPDLQGRDGTPLPGVLLAGRCTNGGRVDVLLLFADQPRPDSHTRPWPTVAKARWLVATDLAASTSGRRRPFPQSHRACQRGTPTNADRHYRRHAAPATGVERNQRAARQQRKASAPRSL